MLRCRKCRRAIVHSECLSKSQWTAGRLNCHNCRARLGGFNFVNRTVCPCGLDAAVHLSKSRVDQDHRHRVLLVQPRSSRPGRGQNGLLTDSYQGDEASELRGAVLDVLQLHCAATAPGFRPAEGALPLGDREDAQLFSFSPLYCIPHRRCSLEEDGDFGSCFCPSASHSSGQQVRSEAVFEGALVRSAPPWQGLQRRPLESSGDEAGSELLLRRTSGFDRAAEREEEVLVNPQRKDFVSLGGDSAPSDAPDGLVYTQSLFAFVFSSASGLSELPGSDAEPEGEESSEESEEEGEEERAVAAPSAGGRGGGGPAQCTARR
uniref:Uncharacterized protein n=1 Tax=Oryzias latipes TaxID=8090 RepID=A0A3P9I5T9_ORYLA